MSTDAPAPVALPPVQQTDTHQLDKLPDLPPETPFYKHPAFITTVSLTATSAVFMAAAHVFVHDIAARADVIKQFLGSNATLHTLTGGSWMADKVARKGVYLAAATKDGIQSNVVGTP